MLKRGKNRPSSAVLMAEMKVQHGISKTFGRQLRARARCPFPKCSADPDPLFCATHWTLLDGLMRRELLTELRAMRDRGQSAPSMRLRELFKLAIRDMQQALEVGSTTVVVLPPGSIARAAAEARVGPTVLKQLERAGTVVTAPDDPPVRPG